MGISNVGVIVIFPICQSGTKKNALSSPEVLDHTLQINLLNVGNNDWMSLSWMYTRIYTMMFPPGKDTTHPGRHHPPIAVRLGMTNNA